MGECTYFLSNVTLQDITKDVWMFGSGALMWVMVIRFVVCIKCS